MGGGEPSGANSPIIMSAQPGLAADPGSIYLNQWVGDLETRQALFSGAIFIFSELARARSICDFALSVSRETFETDDLETAYHHLSTSDFARLAEAAKRRFTNSDEIKLLLRDFAAELGMDPSRYYFDVPRLRIVPNYDYLHAGVSYAYAPHRDPWYGGPQYQINFWMPVLAISPQQTMALYPSYFFRPVANTSRNFDLEHWVAVERPKAVEHLDAETRLHPLPLEEIDTSAQVRFAGAAANVMMFSGHHLHATIPNRTQRTRFSVDFRFFNVEDVTSSGRGPAKAPDNIDCAATSIDFGMGATFKLDTFASYARSAKA